MSQVWHVPKRVWHVPNNFGVCASDVMSRNVKTAAADVNNVTDAAVLLLMAHLKETGD